MTRSFYKQLFWGLLIFCLIAKFLTGGWGLLYYMYWYVIFLFMKVVNFRMGIKMNLKGWLIPGFIIFSSILFFFFSLTSADIGDGAPSMFLFDVISVFNEKMSKGLYDTYPLEVLIKTHNKIGLLSFLVDLSLFGLLLAKQDLKSDAESLPPRN